ncbi:uncharacterized protein LOC113493671 isoform X2 [Trichoplusia ni]|uniref:Regulatory protein zeste n=1 Tax=Trichoplusia ni TaxID=7111 RepID=A0A7E5VGT4_TRINI|nr:uncharacterized protein LOC113493671 isoform X2 [Trichoplusia ni]
MNDIPESQQRMSNNNRRQLVSYEQITAIIDFMAQHVDFASGNFRSTEARHESKKLWEEIGKVLNNCKGGTRKTPYAWSKYWSDFKAKLKNKMLLLKRQQSGVSAKGTSLTTLEKRAISILGPGFEKKVDHHYTRKPRSIKRDVVKVERLPDPIHVVNSNWKSHSESSGRASVDDDQSNDSAASSDTEMNKDDDEDNNERIAMYPQWLINVERKRAEAELIRAKAEEQRASVSAQNAEAALLQADALRQLAEAARIQAEAITRIAVALESRGERNLLEI